MMDERVIARGVGAVSIGLGAFLTGAPGMASELFGMAGYQRVVRLLGLRDLVIGAGLVSGRAPRRWASARAVADFADAAMLIGGAVTGKFARQSAVLGIGTALGSGALGFWLARRLR